MKDTDFDRIAREVIRDSESLCKLGEACQGVNTCKQCRHEIFIITQALRMVADDTKREVVEGCIGIVETHECKQCASQYGPGEDDDKPDCEEIAVEIKRKILEG